MGPLSQKSLNQRTLLLQDILEALVRLDFEPFQRFFCYRDRFMLDNVFQNATLLLTPMCGALQRMRIYD
jgi:hypothetical protein